MKTLAAVSQIFFLCLLLIETGCGPSIAQSPIGPNNDSNGLSIYARYAPVKIDIMPLTEFIFDNSGQYDSTIKVYVSLLDSFGCQKSSPAVFRFELYEHVQRSAEPKGRRIIIWPDIDLTDPAENNNYWRDFLRAYEFELDFLSASNQNYVLQVTCLSPAGKRLSAEFNLKKHTE